MLDCITYQLSSPESRMCCFEENIDVFITSVNPLTQVSVDGICSNCYFFTCGILKKKRKKNPPWKELASTATSKVYTGIKETKRET